jgi:hypothetical protein
MAGAWSVTTGKVSLIFLGLLALSAVGWLLIWVGLLVFPYVYAFFFADPGVPQ